MTTNRPVLRVWHPVLLPGLIMLCWWLASGSHFAPEYLLPSPLTVGRALLTYVLPGGNFWPDATASLGRIGAGFGLAVLTGLPLGLVSGRSPVAARMLGPVITALRSVPGICWLPLALAWFGIGLMSTVFLVALAAFFPVYLNTMTGAAGVPQDLLRVGRMLGLTGPALFARVILPASMPQIRNGLRLGLGLSFAYLVLGELAGVPDGVGAMIMDARLQGRVELVMAGIGVMAVLGWTADRLLVAALNLIFRSSRRT